MVEWSPFPLLPAYGKMVGKMSKPKDLGIFDTKIEDGRLWVNLP
jgi:hypothetical protein